MRRDSPSCDSTQHEGPLLGSKKPDKAKVPLHKNKIVLGVALSLVLVSVIGTLLWSLDSRLAENNRDRAKVGKAELQLEAEMETAAKEQDKRFVDMPAITQTSNDVEP